MIRKPNFTETFVRGKKWKGLIYWRVFRTCPRSKVSWTAWITMLIILITDLTTSLTGKPLLFQNWKLEAQFTLERTGQKAKEESLCEEKATRGPWPSSCLAIISHRNVTRRFWKTHGFSPKARTPAKMFWSGPTVCHLSPVWFSFLNSWCLSFLNCEILTITVVFTSQARFKSTGSTQRLRQWATNNR